MMPFFKVDVLLKWVKSFEMVATVSLKTTKMKFDANYTVCIN